MAKFSRSNLGLTGQTEFTKCRASDCPNCGAMNTSTRKIDDGWVWKMLFHCRKCGWEYREEIQWCEDVEIP